MILFTYKLGKHPNTVSAEYSDTIKKLLEDTLIPALKEEEITVSKLYQIKEKGRIHLSKLFSILKLDSISFERYLKNCLRKTQIFFLFLNLMKLFLSSKLLPLSNCKFVNACHHVCASFSIRFCTLYCM